MKKTFFLLTGVLFVLLFLGCPNATETPKSNNANLQSLIVSEGSLSPEFDAKKIDYTVTVPYATESLTITGKTADPKASMNPENGVVTVSDLKVGVPKPASIKVKAEDGTEKTYTVTVTREAGSSNAGLASLTLSTGSLIPAFNADTLEYTVIVPNSVTSLIVTGTKADTNATMNPENGVVTLNALKVGETKETIKVKAEDGTEKTYTVTVTREAASSDADLQSLTVSDNFSLDPQFDAATTSYSVTVPYATESLTITGKTADSKARMEPENGEVTVNNLEVGVPKPASIKVKAEDGTEKTYTVTVTREAASSDANLQSLTVSDNFSLDPEFDALTTSYTVTVPYATESLTITGKTADPKASMNPENGVVTLNALKVGETKETIKVKAEDGTEKTYTITVTREGNAYLQSLKPSQGSLSPAFSPTETNYSVTVPYATESLTITGVTADSNASMEPESGEVTVNNLVVGVAQTATIKVRAEDGSTEKTYTFAITRNPKMMYYGSYVPSGYVLRPEEQESAGAHVGAYNEEDAKTVLRSIIENGYEDGNSQPEIVGVNNFERYNEGHYFFNDPRYAQGIEPAEKVFDRPFGGVGMCVFVSPYEVQQFAIGGIENPHNYEFNLDVNGTTYYAYFWRTGALEDDAAMLPIEFDFQITYK